MKLHSRILTVSAAAALLAGCGGGGTNGGAVPSQSQGSISSSKLQVAVGTAYNAADNATGLNVVTTFRGSNGLSATLVNTPSITGPAGFTVPAGFGGAYSGANSDDGTATINGSPQVPAGTAKAKTTLGMFTGAFSYGLAPLNSDQSGNGAYYPGNPPSGFSSSNYGGGGWWNLPFGATTQGTFLLGPPVVPYFNDGTFPPGFLGYSPGFTPFQITPVAGTYTMNVVASPAGQASQAFTASGSLASTTPLPAPTISGVAVANGSLSGTVTVGADPRIVETLVFIVDTTNNLYYTVEVKGAGAQAFTLPGTLGPVNGACQATQPKASICSGDKYQVTAVSFDYPALEAAPPMNTQQTPTLLGAAGQADLSIGLVANGTAP